MLEQTRRWLTYANVMSTIAVFGVLGGGGAYAANKIGPEDIQKDAVRSKHIKDSAIVAKDINKATRAALRGEAGPAGPKGDIGSRGPNGPPGISTTTFAFAPPEGVNISGGTFEKVASKNLPAGSWAIVATANTDAGGYGAGDAITDAVCELRNGFNFIGGATDRRVVRLPNTVKRTLSMNGGAQVPAGGGEVSLWCTGMPFETVTYAQMMMIHVGGFS
jgi:hypothetical protein